MDVTPGRAGGLWWPQETAVYQENGTGGEKDNLWPAATHSRQGNCFVLTTGIQNDVEN